MAVSRAAKKRSVLLLGGRMYIAMMAVQAPGALKGIPTAMTEEAAGVQQRLSIVMSGTDMGRFVV